MILKEAYTYQNDLSNVILEIQKYLCNRDFVTEKKETHYRSKANPEASDEIIIQKKDYDVDFKPMDLIDLMVAVIDEKQKLTDAISKAKRNAPIDADSAIAMNRIKQNFASLLNNMANIKPTEVQGTGTDYKFDVNGEQKPYRYPVTTVTTIDYDRNAVKGLSKRLMKETVSVSTELDMLKLTTEIDFEPAFDTCDDLEDLVRQVKDNN